MQQEELDRISAGYRRFVLSLDGRPLAWTAPHGGRVDWLAGVPAR